MRNNQRSAVNLQFLVTKSKKKRYEQGYDIFQEFYIKIIKERRAVNFFFNSVSFMWTELYFYSQYLLIRESPYLRIS